MQPVLQIKHEEGSPIPELFDHSRNHHQPETHRIPRDHQKCHLPCQAHADESVIEARMRDGRRILPPDHIKQEIKRCKDQNAPDAGNPEHNFGNFHLLGELLKFYSPPTVRPSTRIVGAATDPRNSRSFAISEMLKNNSFRLPATVISSTGYVNSPPEIHIPEAPREWSPVTRSTPCPRNSVT